MVLTDEGLDDNIPLASFPEIHIHHRGLIALWFDSCREWSLAHGRQHGDGPDDADCDPAGGGVDVVGDFEALHEFKICRYPGDHAEQEQGGADGEGFDPALELVALATVAVDYAGGYDHGDQSEPTDVEGVLERDFLCVPDSGGDHAAEQADDAGPE